MDGSNLLLSPNTPVVVKFSNVVPSPGFARAWLSLTPFWTPYFENDVRILGLGSGTGELLASELSGGIELGILHMPGNLSAGEEVLFEVTDFLRGTSAPYITFRLHSIYPSTYVTFTSLENNNGRPSQLILTAIPEPTAGMLMFAGLLSLAAWLRRRAAET